MVFFVGILAAIAAVFAGLVAGIKRILQGKHTIGGAVIETPTDDTKMDRQGAVRSVQGAEITMPRDTLDDLWDPIHLERLARTYWSFLSTCTLGIIKVHYTERERFVKAFRIIPLLTFDAPEYEMDHERGIVRWKIVKGLLVASQGKSGDGALEIDVRRLAPLKPGTARINIEVSVLNFYPNVAHLLSKFVYTNTQSRIHVVVTHGFLRRLVRKELDQSVTARFSAPKIDEVPDPPKAESWTDPAGGG